MECSRRFLVLRRRNGGLVITSGLAVNSNG